MVPAHDAEQTHSGMTAVEAGESGAVQSRRAPAAGRLSADRDITECEPTLAALQDIAIPVADSP